LVVPAALVVVLVTGGMLPVTTVAFALVLKLELVPVTEAAVVPEMVVELRTPPMENWADSAKILVTLLTSTAWNE